MSQYRIVRLSKVTGKEEYYVGNERSPYFDSRYEKARTFRSKDIANGALRRMHKSAVNKMMNKDAYKYTPKNYVFFDVSVAKIEEFEINIINVHDPMIQ
jgi:hypothetical protein